MVLHGVTHKATIESCYHKGNIEVTDGKNIGGITGQSNYGMLYACYHIGDISLKGTEQIEYVGGISGLQHQSVQRCYAIGNIRSQNTNADSLIGGLIASRGISLNIEHNYAQMLVEAKHNMVGSLIGSVRGSELMQENYTVKTNGKPIGNMESITEDKVIQLEENMTNQELCNILNKNSNRVLFKEDNHNQNNGYPVLSWQ